MPGGLDVARAQPGLDLVDGGQDAPAAGQVAAALVGQREPARGAVEQPHIEFGLQRGEGAHHGRQRTAEGGGGGSEAAFLDDANEGLHGA
ncbi:hypothetical protein BKK81_32820 [Cupriavidus sp. USMAHM13]|nr:hypothetical protein BKK81_32820 [Cupriavidus sp. USMAHM13]